MRGSELNGSKVNSSIDLATDKESLVVCQTFRSGNTQLVTIVGEEELMRLRAAIDEALGNSGEPATRLPHGSLWIGKSSLTGQDILGS
ncbi:hypothetical protein CHUUTOTORO_01590 [Serratia phage vB_SmaM-ChuuTotoro]|nr:hypothetical protein CHUUTOTORO_01590 [Serratia phage vB_SmaM-ChuuTotoro]